MAKNKKTEEKAIEREFTVSLTEMFNRSKKKRAPKSVNYLKKFIFKHFRVEERNVSISQALNEFIWKQGREHIPRKLEIKVLKEGEKARVYLKGEKIEKPKEEKKKEKKAETKEEKQKDEELEKKREEKKAKEKAAEMSAIKRGAGKGPETGKGMQKSIE